MTRFAPLAVAWLACTPASAPPAAVAPLLDASRFEDADAEAALDAAPPPGRAAELPGDGPTTAAPIADDPFAPWPYPATQEAGIDAGARMLRGSPADVHTMEGAARGYRVYRHCPNYTEYDVVAVVGTGTKSIPQFGMASPAFGTRPSAEIEKEFWTFANAARRAAAVSSIHSTGASGQCFGPSNAYAVVLSLHDWRQVDLAIRNVGSWLAAHDWNGDVILWPEPVPGPGYPK